MNTQNITRFFENIMRDLYQSVYLFLGGSLDDQTLNWADRGLAFAATVIKIVILLAIIGFIYWFLVYCVKHARAFYTYLSVRCA